MQVIFLGCGGDSGVPRVGCGCDVCRDALLPGSHNYRSGPSIALRYGPSYAQRLVLIDAAPEFRLQATQQRLSRFDALLLTHAHDAHILGLSALVKSQRELDHPLAVHAPAQVLDEVQGLFGYLWTDKAYRRVFQPQVAEEIDVWGLKARALRIDHGLGGVAYGYLLTLDQRRIAYISDLLRPTTELRQMLTGLDLLVLGAGHYYEGIEIWKRSIMDIMAAQELTRDVLPGQAVLTHLSHTVDYREMSDRLPENVSLAYDGLIVEVQE